MFAGRQGFRLRKIARTYGQGEKLLVVENVPVVSCPHCGESYLTAETLYHIEQIKQKRQQVAVERPVAVASYS